VGALCELNSQIYFRFLTVSAETKHFFADGLSVRGITLWLLSERRRMLGKNALILMTVHA
jgi:hypothetical protein